LKNRKSARECRKKRKEERNGMMDELIQLRNDKIKLMAEVDVLTKQLQRLEEGERQTKKLEASQTASPSSADARMTEQRTGGKSSGQCEKSLQAKIDEALSSKFEAYASMLEHKVTGLVQNELKKLTSQSLENKSARSLFDDDLKQDTFNKVHPVKKEL
jgi:predicted  nucleic acid-binding Zn-ribbon protein